MICETEHGSYTSSLTISEEIDENGKTIYVIAKAISTESPSNDTGVDIFISCTIQAV
jgi:hypothetical protein